MNRMLTNNDVQYYSGLDSSASLLVMSHLQSLAKRGITVVVVIHQPSSRCFQYCDDVFLLSRGRCLYNGSARTMADTFAALGHQCPAYFNIAEFGKLPIKFFLGKKSALKLLQNNNVYALPKHFPWPPTEKFLCESYFLIRICSSF